MNQNKCWIPPLRRKLDIEQVFDVYDEPLAKIKKTSFSNDQTATFYSQFPNKGFPLDGDTEWASKSNGNSNSLATCIDSIPATMSVNVVHQGNNVDMGSNFMSTQLGMVRGQDNGINMTLISTPLAQTHQDSGIYTASVGVKNNSMNSYCDVSMAVMTDYQNVLYQQENQERSCPECLSGKPGHFSHISRQSIKENTIESQSHN